MEAFDHSHYVPTFPFSYPFIPATTNPPWMDTRIWSRLPQRLIDRVIAFLPPPAFFRARSVCKRWYSLLFSHTFLQMYLQINPKPYFFIFFKQKTTNPKTTTTSNTTTVFKHNTTTAATVPEEAYIFDPETLSWNRLAFPLIPSGFSPACSSGGLICWMSEEAGSKGLLLSNPLFPSLVTPIPSTLRPRLYPSVGLTITNSSIDVMVAGDDMISPYAVKNLTTESFHIDLGGFYSIWGTTSSLPRLCSLESGKMVYVGDATFGKFYCMNYSPFSVLGYDMGRNEWSKIQAPMRRFLWSPSLVESRGKLVLIAAVEKSKLNVPRSLRMWALQSCGTTWVEIERMPQQLYAQFAEVEGGRGFSCVGNGEFVVVMISGTGTGAEKAVLFDFVRKRWVWVPRCPYVDGGGELNGFAYVPRLATPVTGLLDQLTTLNSF